MAAVPADWDVPIKVVFAFTTNKTIELELNSLVEMLEERLEVID